MPVAEPILTVLMTVRNGEPFLREAVSSMLSQTYGDFRFLILDNASTDNSREVIKSFRDPRIELVELPRDVGHTAILARGLGLVETPWVARMDADDVALPQRLERQMAWLDRHGDVVLLGTWNTNIDETGAVWGAEHPPTDRAEIVYRLLFNCVFAHSSVVYRRSAALEAGGYDPAFHYAQDYALWCRMARRHAVGNLPEELVRIRHHARAIGRLAEWQERKAREVREIRAQHLRELFGADAFDQDGAAVLSCLDGLDPDCDGAARRAVARMAQATVERLSAHGDAARRLRRRHARWLLRRGRRAAESGVGAARWWLDQAVRQDPAVLATRDAWATLGFLLCGPRVMEHVLAWHRAMRRRLHAA